MLSPPFILCLLPKQTLLTRTVVNEWIDKKKAHESICTANKVGVLMLAAVSLSANWVKTRLLTVWPFRDECR